mgnify:CR=1 FL=1
MNEKTIPIICINDFHAEIFETEHALGSAKLSGLVKSFKTEHPHAIVVFGGDNYKGDPVSEHLSGEPVTYLIKSLGAKASAVGNHEFDFDLETLRGWSRQGDFTFVAANVLDKRTGRIAEGFEPYAMIEADGAKIAFIGLSTVEQLDRPPYPEDIRALEIVNGAREARKWVAFLNGGGDPRGKPDAIVALTHFGLKHTADRTALIGEEAIDLCRQVPELAGVFTAHWHQFISADIGGIPVVQGGGNGRGFAVLTLRLSSENRLRSVTPGFVDGSGRIEEIPADEDVRLRTDEFKRQAMKTLGAVVGRLEEDIVHKSPVTAEVDMEGTPLTKLAIDVMREQTGCPIAMLYSGRMGLGLPKGEVTLYQLLKLFYFNDEIVTMKLAGADLIKNIENGICTLRRERASPLAFGGLRVVADYDRPYGRRIESVVLENGQPLEPDREYDIAVDEFIASNEMGYDFSAGTERKHTGVFLRDRMIRAIEERGGLAAEYPVYLKVKNKQ